MAPTAEKGNASTIIAVLASERVFR